jgi:hypothetical protein
MATGARATPAAHYRSVVYLTTDAMTSLGPDSSGLIIIRTLISWLQ